MKCRTSLLFFDIPLLYYHINLRSSKILCFFSGDVYLSFGISLSNFLFSVSLLTVPKLFCAEVLQTFVNLLIILLPTKWWKF